MTPILEIKHLHKHFPIVKGLFKRTVGYVYALNDVSFKVYPGEVLGIVGESGSGKSTLGRTIARLTPASSGQVYFKNKNFLRLNPYELKQSRQSMQFIFQDPYSALNPRKTILDSLQEPLQVHGLSSKLTERQDLVQKQLQDVGLSSDYLYRYPHELSGGQQQRINLSRALLLRPQLLICDEIVSSLDLSVQVQIMDLLMYLKKINSFTYLFISHDLSVVKYLCDKILVMYRGKVVESASTQDLFIQAKHPYTQSLIESLPKEHPSDKRKKHILLGESPSNSEKLTGCPFFSRCPVRENQCQFIPPPLKEASNASHTYSCIH